MVYYNKTEFLKYKVPLPTVGWTWSQFHNDAALMTKNSGGAVYGYIDDPYLDQFLAYAVDNGASYLKNGQLDLDTPADGVAPGELRRFGQGQRVPVAAWPTQPSQTGGSTSGLTGRGPCSSTALGHDFRPIHGEVRHSELQGRYRPPARRSRRQVGEHPRRFRLRHLAPTCTRTTQGWTSPLCSLTRSRPSKASPARRQSSSSPPPAEPSPPRTAQQKYWTATVKALGVANVTANMDAALQNTVGLRHHQQVERDHRCFRQPDRRCDAGQHHSTRCVGLHTGQPRTGARLPNHPNRRQTPRWLCHRGCPPPGCSLKGETMSAAVEATANSERQPDRGVRRAQKRVRRPHCVVFSFSPTGLGSWYSQSPPY